MTKPTSFRLTADDLARLASLALPGESQIGVLRRALAALAAAQTAQDTAPASSPHDALASRVDALQASLGARLAELEAWRDSLAQITPPTSALPDALPVALPPGPVARDALPVATPDALPGAYPLEVKRLALAMQDRGHPNRVIGQAILDRTGRRPDSKNMTALLKSWRKVLSA
ncbi:MAG: hypothetical protein KA204_04155 [Chromatiaceae bacterium]|nr:hypothetical protein [Chromatiaceae bacterium]MBP6582651.1 hypothetical protein [Chromatiaceae bacterium]MBP8197123.1 hypothetical protein [Chromatiaceae bacterium]MBP8282573.1 hypothetical protein [Chromatiaceae bacterium]MBP9603928.1 hypothetical protein [Chromatiaceae bacterium]